jgi:hypothetical protein
MSALRWLIIGAGWWLVASLFVAALFSLAVRHLDREPEPEPELDERDAADNARPLGNVTVLDLHRGRR